MDLPRTPTFHTGATGNLYGRTPGHGETVSTAAVAPSPIIGLAEMADTDRHPARGTRRYRVGAQYTLRPQEVSLIQPTVTTITETIASSGRVRGVTETVVGAQAAGIVETLYVDEGIASRQVNYSRC